ncbi:MAG TPA: helix-turn-helix transcriptional regulator [Steroidobacteraceae bacterium]
MNDRSIEEAPPVKYAENGLKPLSEIASAIGEPARARILMCLMDGQARTSTELAVIAQVGASTASAHLHRLQGSGLITVLQQGKHRYYSLRGPDVAAMMERISVLAGGAKKRPAITAQDRMRAARSCYDHFAGMIGVALHDRFTEMRWLVEAASGQHEDYELSAEGTKAFGDLGIDLEAVRARHRRFARGCLDWSERRFHLGGALGAALLSLARKRKWVFQELDSRILRLTDLGRREIFIRLGVRLNYH